MTTNDLIHLLVEKGIKLIPQSGGALDVDGPDDAMTEELIEELRRHKVTILRRMAAIERIEVEPVCRRLDRLIQDPQPKTGENDKMIVDYYAHNDRMVSCRTGSRD